MKKDYVIVTWDGTAKPFPLIDFDAEPAFELVAFCYNGASELPYEDHPVFYQKTEFKGDTFSKLIAKLHATGDEIDYVGFIDDDIEMSISGINHMLADARSNAYGSFAASLTADSPCSHKRFIAQPGSDKRFFPWIEVMAPFYKWDLLARSEELIADNISSYGIDQFVMPMLQKMHDLPHAVLYDCVSMRHTRPVTSDARTYSNGLDAHQERVVLRHKCIAHVKRMRPDLVGTAWWFDWVAPWNSPLGFLLPRLTQPFHLAKGAWRKLVAQR